MWEYNVCLEREKNKVLVKKVQNETKVYQFRRCNSFRYENGALGYRKDKTSSTTISRGSEY